MLSRAGLACVTGAAALVVLPLPSAGSAGAGPDPPVPAASAPIRLLPVTADVASACRRVQARTRVTVLCPTLLPRAFLRDIGFPPPFLHAQPIGWNGGHPTGLDIGYGAPSEPDSGSDWKEHLWRNRPCC